MDDRGLLDQYAVNESERAFAEIVRRYTPMVYSPARRRAGAEDAEDVTQAVFIILACKARRLVRGRRTNLAGWLFRTTRFAASEARRQRLRREARQRTEEARCEMIGGQVPQADP